MSTNGVGFEKHTIHSGSYAGDSPMPGLVHRGIPLPKEQDTQLQDALGFLPVQDQDKTKYYKLTYQGTAKWHFTEPDSFRDIDAADSAYKYTQLVNPDNRPELFVVGATGAGADSYLNIMGETR